MWQWKYIWRTWHRYVLYIIRHIYAYISYVYIHTSHVVGWPLLCGCGVDDNLQSAIYTQMHIRIFYIIQVICIYTHITYRVFAVAVPTYKGILYIMHISYYYTSCIFRIIIYHTCFVLYVYLYINSYDMLYIWYIIYIQYMYIHTSRVVCLPLLWVYCGCWFIRRDCFVLYAVYYTLDTIYNMHVIWIFI